MQRESNRNLELLAEQDPVSRPLARMQLEALRTTSDAIWESAASSIPADIPAGNVPVLHNRQLSVDLKAAGELVGRLTDEVRGADVVTDESTLHALRHLDPLALLRASIEWDAETFEDLANEVGVDPPIVITLGHCASMPILLACGRRVMPAEAEFQWDPGYCPVCASWPLLAEQRGLDKQQWLRCGRCSTAWRTRHQRCIFCDNTDHRKLGYMAPEAERESRRAVTCEVCHGYLKVFATVSPLAIADILRQDLASLELDIAAMDKGYGRPVRPGYPIEVDLVPAETSVGRWLPWR